MKRAQSSPSDAASQCRSELKDLYTTTGSYVQLIPWVDDDMKHIRDVCTELQLEKGDQDDIEGYVSEYGDIFLIKKHGKVIKRVILCGLAGLGKSTITDKMAYDWATGIALQTFTLLFVLKMSTLDQTSDLVESVFDQLLSDDTNVNKRDLEGYIQSNGSRVLILIDGFDEFRTINLEPNKFGPILRMLNRKVDKECFVVVTTRPSHFAKLASKSLIEKPFTHVKVLGFSMIDIGQHVRKFFPAKLDVAEGLLDRIQASNVLSDLARSPLLLLLMCLLWREEETLPNTLSRLFSEAITYIFRRKMPNISEVEISEVVIAIGEVALKGLISPEQRLSFQEEEFEKSVLDKTIQAGILTSQSVIKWLVRHKNVQFIHKTHQEYCAAVYWQSLLSKGDGEFQKILDKIGDPMNFEYMLRFCCGDNRQCTRHILQKLLDNPDNNAVKTLAINCYFESQSRDLSVEFIESFFNEYIQIDDYSNDSLNSLVWLLQHVAVQTELLGVDYLAKVRRVRFHMCDLSRLSEAVPVVSVLSTMTKLSELHFYRCTLTGSNDDQPSSSNAGYFDRSVKQLVVQLRGIKSLAKIRLQKCRLDPRDVKDIALSVAEMPNLADLNLSDNTDLGGNAGTWAASLQRMMHLKSLDLSSCDINEQDVSHIASSIGEMPKLTDLNLSQNRDLGVKIGTWAANLQKMIHLKKLDMSGCYINIGDAKYIAESVSRMRNLVHCDISSYPDVWSVTSCENGVRLSIMRFSLTDKDMVDTLQSFSNRRDVVSLILWGIRSLGGSADVWTPALHNLTQLKAIRLLDCSLQSTDIEPLAAALSGMPTVESISLEGNNSLRGSAHIWAPSLKQIKHVRSLKLRDCVLTEEDKKHISEARGSGVDFEVE